MSTPAYIENPFEDSDDSEAQQPTLQASAQQPSSRNDAIDNPFEDAPPPPINYNKNTVPKLAQPVSVESSGADKVLGALAPRTVQRAKPSGEALPGFEGSYSSGDTGKGAVMTGAGIAAGTTLLGAGAVSKAIPLAKSLGAWISANPVKSYLAYEVLKDFLPSHIHGLYKAAKKAE